MRLTLQRVTFNAESPTYGVLLNHDMPLALVAERPWLNNAHDISCIPPGVFQCVPHNTPDKPNCWELTNVPDRTGILIHAGNNPMVDSLGCLLVGTEFYQGGVKNSQLALDLLRKSLPQNFELEILNP